MFHARKVKSVTVVTEKDVVHRATQLENALTGQHPLDTLIDKYEEKNDDSWKVIRALLVQENQRDHLIHYLGLERDKIASEIDKILGDKKPLDSILDEKKDSKEAQPVAIDPDFFTQVQERKQEPLKLCTQNKDDIDGLIARTVALGDFESAVDLCLHQDRVSDALMFSIYGGKDLLEKTQQSYFQRTTNRPYISLLKSLMTDDLGHLVKSVSLDDWKSTLIALCSYATPEEFSPLCNLLGQRLEAASMLAECLLCYLSSKSLENVCRIWIANFKYNTEMDLQRIIGRITIFMKIIGFSDKDLLKETSLPSYPLSPLYELYIQYAHFLASQGKLSCSLYYLNRIPHGYNSIQLAFLHDRVYHATSSNDATNIRHIQRPEIPYEIKPIKVIQTPVQQYKPVRSSPLISNNYNTAYTPVVAAAHSPLIPNSYTSTSSTTYSYSTNNFSPRPKNSHIATKSPLTPKINHIQATHNYSPTVSYTPSNNGYTTYSQNYTTSTPQNNNYSQQQQQPSHFTSYQSNGGYQATSHSPSLNKTSTQAYNNYSAATSHYQQPSPPVTFYHQSYSPKIPAPPPVVDISPVTETTPRPTAFHDPPPMLISKTPKRNTTPVKRVMSPFPNQTLQSNYSPAGSPRPTNALPPPPMNAAAPAPLSRQKTPTYDYYQQNTRMQ
jgi:protein transport protein SEC31